MRISWIALGLFAMGCTTRPVAPNEMPEVGGKPDVEVMLVDSTRLRIDGSRATLSTICGLVRNCDGASCDELRSTQCVMKDRISWMAVHEVDRRAVAGVILAGLVVAGGIAATAAVTSQHTTTTTTYASSPPAGSYGAGMGSCPRIYSWDGHDYSLDSGTFGLSYFEADQHTDFDRLDRLVADQGTYRMRLINEQPETEHTDLVRLRVIDHPAGSRVVPMSAGKLLTFRSESLPIAARDFRGKDALEWVTALDGREWTSDLTDRHFTSASDARDGLRLVFAKPKNAKVAKLRVAAHNTDWAAKMIAYLLAHRGPDLMDWWARMNADAKARDEIEAFFKREGMLNLRVKTPAGWKDRGLFLAAGPEIAKEEAFEIVVEDVPGDTVEIELESALDFWSIDAAAIAFGPDEPVVVRDVPLTSARTKDGQDITSVLSRADGVRFDTEQGDVAELSFAAPPPGAPGTVRSFIVETKGFYVPHITPAQDADPTAMDSLVSTPFAASRLALALHLAHH
jgi:hypothetical protein